MRSRLSPALRSFVCERADAPRGCFLAFFDAAALLSEPSLIPLSYQRVWMGSIHASRGELAKGWDPEKPRFLGAGEAFSPVMTREREHTRRECRELVTHPRAREHERGDDGDEPRQMRDGGILDL